MSSLRRRTHDSSWQWLAIGVVLGLGCSGVLCLGMYLLNIVRFGVPGELDVASAPTMVLVVTATPEPATPTTEIIATTQVPPAGDDPTITPQNALVPNPSDTPVQLDQTLASSTQVATAATASNTTATAIDVASILAQTATKSNTQVASNQTTPQNTEGTGQNQNASGGNPDGLNTAANASSNASNSAVPSIIATTLIPITGSNFEMGTTLREAQQAVDDCTSRDSGRCDLGMTEDSFPNHSVYVNAFQIEKYEVSYQQFVDFLNYLGPNSHVNQCGGQPCAATNTDEPSTAGSYLRFNGTTYSVASELYKNRPVTFVTWYGADAYCRTIGRRLPTEAEWERAARYTDKRIFPWGNDWDPTVPKALTSRPTNQKGPDLVDSYNRGQSQEGVFNLAGNVSEWVADWYDPQYYKAQALSQPIDPKGPVSSPVGHKVVRGGDWDALPFFARAVHRRDFDPTAVNGVVGFRCAADGASAAQPTSASVKPGGTTGGTGSGTAGTSSTGGTGGTSGTGGTQPTPVSQPTTTFTPGSLPSGNENP